MSGIGKSTDTGKTGSCLVLEGMRGLELKGTGLLSGVI